MSRQSDQEFKLNLGDQKFYTGLKVYYAWSVFAALLFFAGLLIFVGSPLTGLVALSLAAYMMPTIKKRWIYKLPKVVRFLILALLILLLFLSMYLYI